MGCNGANTNRGKIQWKEKKDEKRDMTNKPIEEIKKKNQTEKKISKSTIIWRFQNSFLSRTETEN